jgi:hypothetical protein
MEYIKTYINDFKNKLSAFLSPLVCGLNPIQIAKSTRGRRVGADIYVRRNDNHNEIKKIRLCTEYLSILWSGRI